MIAGDLAAVSSLCDDLIESLNAKCLEDIANRPVVAPLMETLQMVNAGQGLGCERLENARAWCLRLRNPRTILTHTPT